MHLKLAFNWDLKPLYNVIARIPGSRLPDEWIIRGNHHDAWVNGAEDPVSGASALMEEARGLGALLKQGWKPKRTIIYCAWDGEEPGLLGSTEWAEAHADELQRKAAVYINSDGNGRGFLGMEGSHTLEKFINGVARDIDDPETKLTVWKRLQAQRHRRTAHRAERAGGAQPPRPAHRRARLRLRLHGVPRSPGHRVARTWASAARTAAASTIRSTTISTGTRISPTRDFVYGRALAQTAGTTVMRLADAELLPFDFDDFTDTIRRYVDEVQKLARDKRDQIIERNRQIDEGVFAAINDPRQQAARAGEGGGAAVPEFRAAGERPRRAAAHRPSSTTRRWRRPRRMAASALARAVAARGQREADRRRARADAATRLPNRPWFKHQIYAPGFYTGYGVKTLPAVRESIEQKQWKLAEEQIVQGRQGPGERRRGHPGRDGGTGEGSEAGATATFSSVSCTSVDWKSLRWRRTGPRMSPFPGAASDLRPGGEIAAPEEVGRRDDGGAHRTVFVSALRPGQGFVQPEIEAHDSSYPGRSHTRVTAKPASAVADRKCLVTSAGPGKRLPQLRHRKARKEKVRKRRIQHAAW